MIWRLKDLIEHANQNSARIGDKWVPARPLNWTCRTPIQRVREALAVFTGKAEAFEWPEGQ
jgi:hypothetical protein